MKLKLWQKLLLPTVLGLLVVIGLLVTVSTAAQNSSIIEAENERLNYAYAAFGEEIKLRGQMAVALATVFAQQPQVQRAAAEQDREALLQELAPVYESLETQYGIKHMYVHTGESITLVRVHQPDQWGDSAASFRHMISEVNTTQQPAAGLEMGRNGIGIRGAVPISYQGEPVGVFEIGLDLEYATLVDLQQERGGEWRIFLTSDAASLITNFNLTSLESGPVESLLTYTNTTDYLLPGSDEVFSRVVGEDQQVIERLEIGDHHYAVMSAPIHDYQGNVLGVLQIEYPRDETEALIEQTQRRAITLGVGTAAAAVAGLVLVIQFSLRPLRALTQATERLAQGDLNTSVAVNTQDEIGELGHAFNKMASQLHETLASLEASVKEAQMAMAMAREASRLKSEFLANMSHELRTPLNAVIGFADTMLAGMSGDLNEKQTHKLTRIQLNSKRLLGLINDLLDLAKIEAGRVEVLRVDFSPAELAASVRGQMESLAEQKGIEFRASVDAALPEMVIGDPERIEQVVKNLLSNAFKFTERGVVDLKLSANGHQTWTLAVSDTGIGIPPHALEYIFDEFRQVDTGSQRAYGGSGLGLAITRNLVRLMDGDIRVTSVVGEGSTFVVTLPLMAAEHPELIGRVS